MVSLNLPQVLTAIGGLSIAAFGLVDATKALGGGVNHIGFKGIKTRVVELTPPGSDNALSQEKILATLQAKWFNGTDLGSQKSVAKSLIMQRLNPSNAASLAAVTGVDAGVLTDVASRSASGTPLTFTQRYVNDRFDLIVTALLDETYDRADKTYRNGTKALAAMTAVGLALCGGFIIYAPAFTVTAIIRGSVLMGLLAAPLAPIAKDLSTKAVPLLVRYLIKKLGV
jgi:hypothetical protein